MNTTVTIRGRLPALNEYTDACRKNRYEAAKMKRDAEELIIWQIKRMKPIKSPVIINLTWIEANRRRDPDNVRFAVKFILDAFQKAKKIPNDNSKYIIGFSDRYDYSTGDYGVIIEIQEANV